MPLWQKLLSSRSWQGMTESQAPSPLVMLQGLAAKPDGGQLSY